MAELFILWSRIFRTKSYNAGSPSQSDAPEDGVPAGHMLCPCVRMSFAMMYSSESYCNLTCICYMRNAGTPGHSDAREDGNLLATCYIPCSDLLQRGPDVSSLLACAGTPANHIHPKMAQKACLSATYPAPYSDVFQQGRCSLTCCLYMCGAGTSGQSDPPGGVTEGLLASLILRPLQRPLPGPF